MTASKDNFEKFILNHAAKIREAILSANTEQLAALNGQSRAKAKKRTIASLMNDLVTHNLEERLVGSTGIIIRHPYNQLVVIFSPDYILKCKKSERGKISSNNTQLMFDFMHQLPLMLPDMPAPATNIFLTYEWNKARTEIQKIVIRCPNGQNDYIWEVPIPITAEQESMPKMQPETPNIPTQTKKIVPKAKRIKKSKRGLIDKNEQGKENQS